MRDDSGNWIFFVGSHGAAVHTGWLDAMMTGRRDVLDDWIEVIAAGQ
jgi:hypothetical protein